MKDDSVYKINIDFETAFLKLLCGDTTIRVNPFHVKKVVVENDKTMLYKDSVHILFSSDDDSSDMESFEISETIDYVRAIVDTCISYGGYKSARRLLDVSLKND